MMDWVLDIYDQTEHLLIIAPIIALIIGALWAWRFVEFQEWQGWFERIFVTFNISILFIFVFYFLGMYLKQKSEERKATQLEQPLANNNIIKPVNNKNIIYRNNNIHK